MIPKIIHQIWSGIVDPLPPMLKEMAGTWKIFHPDWVYEFWDNARMEKFLDEYFPQYRQMYDSFPYNIQRWDAIRYLILYKEGGMYVDFDYECLEPLDSLLEGKKCCFSREPEEHILPSPFDSPNYFNNALMACEPGNDFLFQVIKEVFLEKVCSIPRENKGLYVLCTTGPQMLTRLYEHYDKQNEVYLIPPELVSPFSISEVRKIFKGENVEFLEKKLQPAKAVHYFFGSWHR